MLTATVGLCLVIVACSAAEPIVATSQASAIPFCSEVPVIEAAPDLYGESPKYVGNEMPVEEVQGWAATQPGFAGIWIDRDHNGWVTVGFTEEAAERQTDIEQLFPGEGVVAVGVEWTEDDLATLQRRVHEELPDLVQASGGMINFGVVSVHIGVLSDENIAEVEAHFTGQPLCVEGRDPADVVPPGPQQETGDGWRLLVAERGVGDTYRTGLAFDEKSLRTLLDGIGLDATLDIDFETEIAIWFGAVYGSSCPDLRLDDVVVDGETIYAEIVLADDPIACTDDANPLAYIVALDRDRLPPPPFAIQLDSDEPPAGAPMERTTVNADLRPGGSVAEPHQIGPDLEFRTDRPAVSGDVIEIGFPWQYQIDLRCGMEYLGEVNSYDWTATSPLPESWVATTEGVDTVVVEILLRESDPPSIEVTLDGATVVYEISDSPDCG